MKVREPNGPIQVAPTGLLGLLSLKTGGQMPDAMRQDLQPSVDLESWWLRSKRVLDSTNRGISLPAANYDAFVAFSPNGITVPETEWWFVHSYSVKGSISNVGDSMEGYRLAMAFNAVGTIRYRYVGEAPFEGFVNLNVSRQLLLAESFWMPPGARLGFYAGNLTGPGSFDVTMVGLDYTVCPT